MFPSIILFFFFHSIHSISNNFLILLFDQVHIVNSTLEIDIQIEIMIRVSINWDQTLIAFTGNQNKKFEDYIFIARIRKGGGSPPLNNLRVDIYFCIKIGLYIL